MRERIAVFLCEFLFFYRATPLRSQNKTDKNSNRNSVRVLAWYLACKHASGYLKILYAILELIYIISLPGDCHAYARNDKRVGTPTPERTLIQSVLIYGMCLFRVRAARRREYERRA